MIDLHSSQVIMTTFAMVMAVVWLITHYYDTQLDLDRKRRGLQNKRVFLSAVTEAVRVKRAARAEEHLDQITNELRLMLRKRGYDVTWQHLLSTEPWSRLCMRR
jgi:hypothetical protein